MVMVTSCVRTFLARMPIFDTLGGSLDLTPAHRWSAYARRKAQKALSTACLLGHENIGK